MTHWKHRIPFILDLTKRGRLRAPFHINYIYINSRSRASVFKNTKKREITTNVKELRKFKFTKYRIKYPQFAMIPIN